MCVIQCSPNHSIDERTRSCHPCGSECKSLAREKHRSIQYPNNKALQIVLRDPKKNGGVSIIAIAAVSVSVAVFLVIFGVLQFRSKKQMRYTKVDVEPFSKEDDEEDSFLLNGGEDRHEDSSF